MGFITRVADPATAATAFANLRTLQGIVEKRLSMLARQRRASPRLLEFRSSIALDIILLRELCVILCSGWDISRMGYPPGLERLNGNMTPTPLLKSRRTTALYIASHTKNCDRLSLQLKSKGSGAPARRKRRVLVAQRSNAKKCLDLAQLWLTQFDAAPPAQRKAS